MQASGVPPLVATRCSHPKAMSTSDAAEAISLCDGCQPQHSNHHLSSPTHRSSPSHHHIIAAHRASPSAPQPKAPHLPLSAPMHAVHGARVHHGGAKYEGYSFSSTPAEAQSYPDLGGTAFHGVPDDPLMTVVTTAADGDTWPYCPDPFTGASPCLNAHAAGSNAVQRDVLGQAPRGPVASPNVNSQPFDISRHKIYAGGADETLWMPACRLEGGDVQGCGQGGGGMQSTDEVDMNVGRHPAGVRFCLPALGLVRCLLCTNRTVFAGELIALG
jgi:hypothetical protein